MRNLNRIEPFLEEIAKIWRLNPDLRFGQLIGNVMEILSYGYYYEDDEMLKRIKAYYNWNKEDIDNDS